MKLSAPIHRLKRQAKLLSRDRKIPLHAALDTIANGEGFKSWSMLSQMKDGTITSIAELYSRLDPGDLVLIGARPGHGKTLLSLRVLIEAMKRGKRGLFFSLEYNFRDIAARFQSLDADIHSYASYFAFDNSEAICADYIIKCLASEPRGSFAVIDYLQILDQNRQKPELMMQIKTLKNFVRQSRMTILCISQIDRSYDAEQKSCPDLKDVRLPNPLDLRLFNKACFLNNAEISFHKLEAYP